MRAVILAIAGWLVVLSLAAHAGSENYQGAIPYPSVGGNTSRTPATRANDHGINIKEFGAIGDGNLHLLSGIYGTLAAAQAVYPFVDDLIETVDWAATQAAIDYAYSSGQQVTYCPGVTAPNASYQLSLPIFIDKPGNFRGSNPKWAVGTTYAYNAAVTWNGVPWTSLGAGNVGQMPTLMPLENNDPAAAAVTISNASPAVISWPGLPIGAGQPVIFYASSSDGTAASPPVAGTLPTGISANTVYYILSTGYVASTSFEISATPGGSPINTSSTYTGTVTATNQVWTVTPVIGSSFTDQSTLIGQEGLPSSVGCVFDAIFGNGVAVYIGPNNGNLIKNITAMHTNQTIGEARCGWTPSSIGFGELGNGGGASRTKMENVSAYGFYTDFETGAFSSGDLDDSNTVTKSSLGDACNAVWISQGQNFINGFYDSNLGGVTSILSNGYGGANMWGGNASTNGSHSAFSISSVTASFAGNVPYVQATIASPDQYLTNYYCVQQAACHYNAWTINTAHFGVVPMTIVSFNPFTSVAMFETLPEWTSPYGNTCCGTVFATDIAAATKVFADERATTFSGNGIEVRGVHIENPFASSALIDSNGGINRPNRLTDIYGNADFAWGDDFCCYQNPSEIPSDGETASFYAAQSFPFISLGGAGATANDLIIDALSGGYGGRAHDRLVFSYGAPSTQAHFYWRSLGTGGIQLNFRGTSNDGTSFSGGTDDRPGDQSSCSAGLGCGEFSSPWMTTSQAYIAGNYSDVWKMARGSSPMVGVHPDYGTAGPCVTPAQVAALGSLPAITFSSSLYFSRGITGGGAGSSAGYAAADVLTLVGGTFSQAAQITVETVDGGGGILTWHVTRGGTYSVEPTSFTVTGGTGTGAAFNSAGWNVTYDVSYPLMYGGTQYRLCDWNLGSQTHYGLTSTHFGWSFGQNLTTSNVPNLAWSSTDHSPIVYMNNEAIQLLFPGVNMLLTATGGTSGCSGSGPIPLMITGVFPTLGYVTVMESGQDGTPFLPNWTSGRTCTGTTIGQASYALVNLN